MKLKPLDDLFSERIRKRAMQRVHGCERKECPHQWKEDIVKDNGKIFPAWKQLQCSHFIGRARKAVRWDEDNAAGICAGCHMYFTAHPLEHVKWFTDYLGEEAVDLLLARNRIREKPDIEAITLYLKAQIKELDE